MSRNRARDITVGAFAVLALVVLAIGVMAVGGESRLFTKKASFRATFASTDGLNAGSPVRMAGVQVGIVTRIQLPTDPGATGIEVVMGIDHRYAPRVRRGSQAAMRYLQYLSGEKFVEITPGSPSEPALPENTVLPTLKQSEILEQGGAIADNLTEITVAVKQILEPLQRGEGLLGQMLQDPNFGKEGLESLKATLQNLQDITDHVRRGQGVAGRLVHDNDLAGSLDSLSNASKDLAAFMEALNRREGALGALTRKDGEGERAVADLRQAAASLKTVAARLESKEGLLGRLLNDPEWSERVAGDLRETIGHLKEITRKIDSGQGTLGALVNERVLYDGMEEVVAGVGDSSFARWMLRHYQKKGITAPPAPSPSPAP